jgi:hypothetical protein
LWALRTRVPTPVRRVFVTGGRRRPSTIAKHFGKALSQKYDDQISGGASLLVFAPAHNFFTPYSESHR